jgi:hypothetical protein
MESPGGLSHWLLRVNRELLTESLRLSLAGGAEGLLPGYGGIRALLAVNTANLPVDTGAQQGMQGGAWPAPPRDPNFVQLFMLAEDVHAAVARATALGAKLLIPPTKLPESDEMAVLIDPPKANWMIMRAWHSNSPLPIWPTR